MHKQKLLKLLPLLLITALLFALSCDEEAVEEPVVEDGDVVVEEPERREINLERFGLNFTVANDRWDEGQLVIDPENNAEQAVLFTPDGSGLINILCQQNDEPLTAEDRDLALEDKLWEIEPQFPGFTELSRETIPLAETEAVLVEFTAQWGDGSTWRFYDYTFVRGTTLCGIQFGSAEVSFEELSGELELILASLSLAVGE